MKNILLAIAVIIAMYLIGNDVDVQLANDGNQSPITLTK
jgi:hypothetical protein